MVPRVLCVKILLGAGTIHSKVEKSLSQTGPGGLFRGKPDLVWRRTFSIPCDPAIIGLVADRGRARYGRFRTGLPPPTTLRSAVRRRK
jgi:hypothetical protein